MKKRATVVMALAVILLSMTYAPAAHANAAEPPMLTVTVAFPPDDLTLSIRFADGSVLDAIPLQKEQQGWEAYYRFFYYMAGSERPKPDSAMLIVESGAHNFEFMLPENTFGQYNAFLTLDLKGESAAVGRPPARKPLLVSMRVILTLLIEGLVFFAFGYRKKSSWITFAAVNLVTQTGLNVLFEGPHMNGYWIIGLLFCETVIFIVEIIAFTYILKEHKSIRAAGYAAAANAASFIAGGLLLAFLPV